LDGVGYGNYLTWAPQKTLRPSWCPKLVTGLFQPIKLSTSLVLFNNSFRCLKLRNMWQYFQQCRVYVKYVQIFQSCALWVGQPKVKIFCHF